MQPYSSLYYHIPLLSDTNQITLLADINVIEAGTSKSTFTKYELTGNTFHITVQVRCSVGESITGFSGEGATHC